MDIEIGKRYYVKTAGSKYASGTASAINYQNDSVQLTRWDGSTGWYYRVELVAL